MINNQEHFIVNREKFISSAFGDEMMLMNLDTGDYVALNTVSADIYRLADEKTTAEEVINILLQRYEVKEEECREQVTACIKSMIEKELLLKL